jgi:hypothetical protein
MRRTSTATVTKRRGCVSVSATVLALACAGCGGGAKIDVAAGVRCLQSAGLGPAKSIPDRRAIGAVYGITPTADIVARPRESTRVELFANEAAARRAFEHAKATAAEQQAGNVVVIVGIMSARALARLDRCVFGAGVRPVATYYRLFPGA